MVAKRDGDPEPPPEVISYYEQFPEESRLMSGPFRLEFERTKEIVSRVLPKPPSVVVDVGGAAGTYSSWLSALGYEVHLVDASPRLVEEARRRSATLAKPIASLFVGDARRLPQEDGFANAVLLMGPLYHLPAAADRLLALREAFRVLVPSGVVVTAAISRYASALDGLARKLSLDPRFVRMRDRDLEDGQHRNKTDDMGYFTTAYFHRPEDLVQELESAEFQDVRVFGLEGPGWILSDLDTRWENMTLKGDLLAVARALESEPSILGASVHLLGVGLKR
jgi:ubiquinone/menaquinone biosynthesis C-methylase UbiE